MPAGYAGHQRMKYRAPELHLFKGCVCVCVCVYILRKKHINQKLEIHVLCVWGCFGEGRMGFGEGRMGFW